MCAFKSKRTYYGMEYSSKGSVVIKFFMGFGVLNEEAKAFGGGRVPKKALVVQ